MNLTAHYFSSFGILEEKSEKSDSEGGEGCFENKKKRSTTSHVDPKRILTSSRTENLEISAGVYRYIRVHMHVIQKKAPTTTDKCVSPQR